MLGHVRSASKPTVIVTVVFDHEHQRFHQKFGEQYLRRAANCGTLVLSHAGTDMQIVFSCSQANDLRKQRGEIGKRKEKRDSPFVSSGFTIDEQLYQPLRMLEQTYRPRGTNRVSQDPSSQPVIKRTFGPIIKIIVQGQPIDTNTC